MMEEQCCKRSLIGSLADSAARAIKNPIPIPGDAQRARLETCGRCEHFDGTTCSQCGCIMALKVKFARMECPIGLWGEHPG
jgi:hypothetical protein